MSPDRQWYSITDEMMDEIEPIAEGRDRLSDAASNTRRWTSNFNLTGLVGEKLYSHLTGIPYNQEIKLGDGGEDFPGVDVKTTKTTGRGVLRAPLNFKFRAEYYVLVCWEPERRRARIAGWCTRQEFREAPKIKGKFGMHYALPETKLHEGLPPA